MIDTTTTKLIAFDLDGTLAESKEPIDQEMAWLLLSLLERFDIAIISGGDFPQFEKQVLSFLGNSLKFYKLHLYPTCGAKWYSFNGMEFIKEYSEDLSQADIDVVVSVIEETIQELWIAPTRVYGSTIENRWTQITYSALWQLAPALEKKWWDPDFAKRIKIRDIVIGKIPDHLNVSMGWSTSIDTTRKGIDKAYAIMKVMEKLSIQPDEILFIGDALLVGGNDYPVIATWVRWLQVSDQSETKNFISSLLQ